MPFTTNFRLFTHKNQVIMPFYDIYHTGKDEENLQQLQINPQTFFVWTKNPYPYFFAIMQILAFSFCKSFRLIFSNDVTTFHIWKCNKSLDLLIGDSDKDSFFNHAGDDIIKFFSNKKGYILQTLVPEGYSFGMQSFSFLQKNVFGMFFRYRWNFSVHIFYWQRA